MAGSLLQKRYPVPKRCGISFSPHAPGSLPRAPFPAVPSALRWSRCKKMGRCWREKGNRRGNGAEKMKGGYAMHENRRAQGDREGTWAECDLCGREIGWGESYYRVGGENVCRSCLADFAAQILRVYEVKGGEDV